MISALGKTKAGWGDMRCWAWVRGVWAVSFRVVRLSFLIRRHFRETQTNVGKKLKSYLGGKSWRQREHSMPVFWALIQASRGGWIERGGPEWWERETPSHRRPHQQFGFILCETGNLWSMFCIKALYLCLLYILSVSQNVFLKGGYLI